VKPLPKRNKSAKPKEPSLDPASQIAKAREAAQAYKIREAEKARRAEEKRKADDEARRQRDAEGQAEKKRQAALLKKDTELDEVLKPSSQLGKQRTGPFDTPRAPLFQELHHSQVGGEFRTSLLSFQSVRNFVEQALENDVVLCAPKADDNIKTCEFLGDWNRASSWKSKLLDENGNMRGSAFKKIGTGGYNEVFAPASGAQNWWPRGQQEFREDVVLRVTRRDPFPTSADGVVQMRGMKRDELVHESAAALHAAAVGYGLPVFGIASFLLSDGSYGMFVLVLKADADMLSFTGEDANQTENCALEVQKLCFNVAQQGVLNFDSKPANVLVKGNQFFITDFDAKFFLVDQNLHAGLKARYFTSLLLMVTHVRAFMPSKFASKFCLTLALPLIELWREAIDGEQQFGLGQKWLRTAKLAVSTEFVKAYVEALAARGIFVSPEAAENFASNTSFSQRILAQLQSAGLFKERLSTELTMICFDYFFHAKDGRIAPESILNFPNWVLVRDSRLVPQLLHFSLFFRDPVPERYQQLVRSQI
jgi:hypothetical protein